MWETYGTQERDEKVISATFMVREFSWKVTSDKKKGIIDTHRSCLLVRFKAESWNLAEYAVVINCGEDIQTEC